MGEKRFIFYENIGSAANFLVFLEEFLLLFKKFNRVFFSPFMIAKKFRIVLQKIQNVAPFIYHDFNHYVA